MIRSLLYVHVVHQFFEVAYTDLRAVTTATGENQKLGERLLSNVVVLRLVSQNVNDVMLLELNLLGHCVL